MAHASSLALVLPLVIAAATVVTPSYASDSVPSFNVEPTCTGGQDSPGLNERYGRCINEEKEARQKLHQSWSSYPAADRTQCSGTASMGTPSYVELLTCLEMARDAKKMQMK